MKKKIIIIVLLVMTICGCQKDYKKYSFTDINWIRNNTNRANANSVLKIFDVSHFLNFPL